MVDDLIFQMKRADKYCRETAKLSNICPEAFGEIGDKMPTLDRDVIHKKWIDESENELVVGVREKNGSITPTLEVYTGAQKRWQVFPKKLDMVYNKVIEHLDELDLLDAKDYYTGQFRNCMASGATKGGLVGLGIGLFMGLIASLDVDAKSVWETYQSAGPVMGSAAGVAVGFFSALAAGAPKFEPEFGDAEYLDERIKELYHPEEKE